MRTLIVLPLFALAALAGAAAGGQQTQPLPGPGTGIVPVTVTGPVPVTMAGPVQISTLPIVNAAQQGEWNVRVANEPTVNVGAPEFLKKGGSYSLTWAGGDQEKVVVSQMAPNGWIRTEHEGRARWINLASVRAVEETR